MAPVSHLVLSHTLFICTMLAAASSNNTLIKPISVPPSGEWQVPSHGDGRWSTFNVSVGTPPQFVPLLPGTSATTTNILWVLLHEGCTADDDPNPRLACPTARGPAFVRNESSTWSTRRLENRGLFNLNAIPEGEVGLGGNGFYGWETVGLPALEDGETETLEVEGQLVAGIATTDFWTGMLGLSAVPFNFTSFNEPVPSFVGSLVERELLPSLSWGYTAGAAYREPEALGSLTLGGFDKSRFEANNVVFKFDDDVSLDLTVAVQAISHDAVASHPLLDEGIYMLIDSVIPQIWLPVEVCEAFERAFNLTWNKDRELYPVNEELHDSLLAQDPIFSFTLGTTLTGGSTMTIELPYAAFDLWIDPPYVNNATRYFPLKRAQNSTQHILGRTFLQEAYVIIDYGRHEFSVSQAKFPDSSLSPLIAAITKPGHGSQSTGEGIGGLGIGATAGIAIGIAVVVIAVAVLAWLTCRRRRKLKRASVMAPESGNVKSPVTETVDHIPDVEMPFEIEATQSPRPELLGDNEWKLVNDRPWASHACELPSPEARELDATSSGWNAVELDANTPGRGAVELDATTPGQDALELDTTTSSGERK